MFHVSVLSQIRVCATSIFSTSSFIFIYDLLVLIFFSFLSMIVPLIITSNVSKVKKNASYSVLYK